MNMQHGGRRWFGFLLAVGVGVLWTQGVSAQDEAGPPTADPAAERAFAELIKAYRAAPVVSVKVKLDIELKAGEMTSKSDPVEAEFTRVKSGDGVAKLRGFTCHIAGTNFAAVHESTGHSFYEQTFEGSPYWVMFSAFQDMPFPHLALFWGEDSPEHVRMQMVSKTPMLVPTKVEDVQKDGKKIRQLSFASEHGELVLNIDPKTKRVLNAEHVIRGGPYVQPGSQIISRYTYTWTAFDAPPGPDAVRFDPAQRQRAASMVALIAPDTPDAMPGPGDFEREPQKKMVGEVGPAFTLATLAGDAVDLEELRGQVVVLDFWATWCGPCARALPELHELRTWASREDLPLQVIPVNVFEVRNPANNSPDARRASVARFWDKRGFTLPVAMDYTDATAKAYGVEVLPTTFIIRADGVVHWQDSGFGAAYLDTLKKEVRAALEAVVEDGDDAP